VERYDIAIVGLGGIGSATSWFAARAGRSVIGLERFELGGHHHGASHDHSRIIRHSYHTPHYVGLTRLAYDAWREVEAESDEACVHITGGIDLFPNGAAIDSATYRDSMLAYDVVFDELEPADVMARWPAWHVEADTEVLYQANTGIVSPASTVPLLQRLALDRGAKLRGNTMVTAIEPKGDDVTIHLADGEQILADQVVIAADAWTTSLVAPLGTALPLTVTRGTGHVLRHRYPGRIRAGQLPGVDLDGRPVLLWIPYVRPAWGEDRPGLRRIAGGS
jgi:sarcosine oxidase